MARFSVIEVGLAGVDMLVNPLFLQQRKAAFAKNIQFEEATIKTRPGFRYHNLNVKGKWQGGSYFSPSTGLSALSYTNSPAALANVVDGKVWLNPIGPDGIGQPISPGSIHSDGPVFTYDAEDYLILHAQDGATYWSKAGHTLVKSVGLQECTEEESHDTFDPDKHRHWLPNGATVGAYAHGRLHVSIPYGVCQPAANSELAVSDLISKRGCLCSDDILKMEEHMNASYGGGLAAPSRLGPTKALAVLRTGALNGEGELIDFRKSGIVRHNTLGPRETRYDADGTQIKEGWDTQRITHVVLNTVGAVGPYAAYELPNDIFFRSQYGLHFYRRIIGEGTYNDETTNSMSQDVDPLLRLDQYSDEIEGAAVGHWLYGDRFFGTVGLRATENTALASGQGFVSFNQTFTFTEDRTPRIVAEGLWTPDCGITDIHRFVQASECPNGQQFGFICSDKDGNLYYAEPDFSLDGVDVRDGKEYPIQWEYVSGQFAFGGFEDIKEIGNGYLDAVVDESSSNLEGFIKTDQHDKWEAWGCSHNRLDSKTLLSGYEFGVPKKSVREGTWFQFKLTGKGYVDLRTLDIDASKITKKSIGQGRKLCLNSKPEEYFHCI